jgi:O-antigen/teichoic acid export membrane protein
MLIRQTILYLPAQLLGPLAQFVAAIVWTHWLAPGPYGQLTAIMAAQELAFVGFLSWWSGYTLRFLGSFDTPEARQRLRRAENSILSISAIGQSLLAITVLVIFRFELTPLLVLWTVLFTTSRSLLAHLSERARAQGQIAAYTVAQLFGPVFGFALAYVFVAQVSASPVAALAGFAVAQIIGAAISWRMMGMSGGFALPARDILLPALTFGVPLVLAGAIAWISLNGIRLIVERINGAEALGLISVGWALGQRLASVAAMLVTAAAYPLAVARMDAGEVDEALWQLSAGGALLLGILAPMSAGIFMVTPQIVELMIAEPFREVTMLVLPLAALGGAIRNFRVHFFDQTILLFKQTSVLMWLSIGETVVTVAACAFGAYTHGIYGAVVGCLAGIVFGLGVGLVICVVRFRLRLPWDAAWRVAVATSAMALTVYLAQAGAPASSSWLALGLQVAAGALVYVASLALLYPQQLAVRLRQFRAARSPRMEEPA